MDVGLLLLMSLCRCSALLNNAHRPQGIRMCEDQCRHVKGCAGVQFEKVYLRCHLVSENGQSGSTGSSNKAVIEMKEIHDQCPVQRCTKGDECIHSRLRSGVCLHGTGKTRDSEEKKTRLLIISTRDWNKHHIKQVNLNDLTVSQYPYLRLKYVMDMVYVTFLRTLLIATNMPTGLVSYRLDSEAKETFLRTKVSDIEVDEEKRFVFVSIEDKYRTIGRISIHDKQFSVVRQNVKKGSRANDIVLDTTHEIVYMSFRKDIARMQYDGGSLEFLFKSAYTCAMVFDPIDGILYYNDKKDIKKWILSENTSSVINRLPFDIKHFEYYQQHIYVMDKRNGKNVFKLDVTGKKAMYKLLLRDFSSTFHFPVISFVP